MISATIRESGATNGIGGIGFAGRDGTDGSSTPSCPILVGDPQGEWMMKRILGTAFDPSHEAWIRRRQGTPAGIEAWAKEETRWKKLGIEPRDILHYLRNAGEHRAQYEAALKAGQEIPEPFLNPEGQKVRRLLDQAGPFIEFLKNARDNRKRLYFGNLGYRLEKRVRKYKQTYYLDRELAPTPRLPRHRPGEPWLETYVLKFAEMFHARGASWEQTRDMIFKALTLAGHGDVVTVDKIRNYIRQVGKRNPHFGDQRTGQGGG